MPMKRELYPANWAEISAQIRQRAGNRCEWPACGVRNGEILQGKRGLYRVVLTTAHLNHDPSDCRPENLRAYCQRHHLRYDAPQHAKNAAITRHRNQVARGQTELFADAQAPAPAVAAATSSGSTCCPRCHRSVKVNAHHPLCERCRSQLWRQAAQQQEADYLARYLSTREDDTSRNVRRLRARAEWLGVDIQHPPEPVKFDMRLAALVAAAMAVHGTGNYRQRGRPRRDDTQRRRAGGGS